MNQIDKDTIKLLLLQATFDELREVRATLNSIWDDRESVYASDIEIGQRVDFLDYEHNKRTGAITYLLNKTVICFDGVVSFTIPVSNILRKYL